MSGHDPAPAPESLVSMAESAKRLGISRRSLNYLVAERALSVVHLPGMTRSFISSRDLDALIARAREDRP